MFIRRSIVLCALCILALSATPALAAGSRSAALAQERYYSTLGATGNDAALAQERYYSSFGTPAPLSVPQPTATPADGDLLPVVLIVVATIALAGVGTIQIRRVRGRRTAGAIS